MPLMGVVYELLIMRLPTMSIGGTSFTVDVAERIDTVDTRNQAFGTGFTIHRPNDVRGDSVNQLIVGARLDMLTEHLAERRAKADKAAVTEQEVEILNAQAAHEVPVTGIQTEPAAA